MTTTCLSFSPTHSLSLSNYTPTGYPPGVTPELLPFLSHSGDHYRPEPPTILHKNSFYYNQAMAPGRTKPAVAIQVYAYSCEWGECRAMLPTVKELSEHVQDEHISVLPVHLSKYKVRSSKGHRLTCEWRGCTDKGNEFPARYKLVLHVQTCHCKEHKVSTTIKVHLYSTYQSACTHTHAHTHTHTHTGRK